MSSRPPLSHFQSRPWATYATSQGPSFPFSGGSLRSVFSVVPRSHLGRCLKVHPVQGHSGVVVSILTPLGIRHHFLILDHFSFARRKPHAYQHPLTIPLPALPLRPLGSFLSPWIGLFWTFQTSGIIRYVCLCVWLLYLSVFSKFPQVVACVCTPFPFMTEQRSTV